MKTYKRKPAFVAAVVALALLLTGCAAAVVLGLKDLKMGQTPCYSTEEAWDQISLQGFVGSSGYRAAQEWKEFCDSYDPDWKHHLWAAYHHFEAPEAYAAFNCCSQEMIDKLDEICEKYDLTLPGKGWVMDDVSRIYEATGIPGIKKEGNPVVLHLDNGYCYDDGSFYVEGGAQFSGQRVGDMFFMNCNRKGTFHASTDSVTDIDSFDQWYYTMKDGTQVLLADHGEEVVMIADRKDFFTTVRLYGEGVVYILDQNEKRKAVEAMAECIDFGIEPRKADPAVLNKSLQDTADKWEQLDSAMAQDYRCANYQAFMRKAIHMKAGFDHRYALYDLDGDGSEELFLRLPVGIEEVLTYNGQVTSLVLHARGLHGIELCEGGVFCYKRELDNCFSYTFCHLKDGQLIPFDFVEYHDEAPAHWGRSQDGDEIAEQEITESEARRIIDSYQLIELDWKPVEDFPME